MTNNTVSPAPDGATDENVSLPLPAGYQPSNNEKYMSVLQLEYFRRLLLRWREDILQESQQTLGHLQSESLAEPDRVDRASLETNTGVELRTRDRYRKLLGKIEAALQRIEEGTYGYCEKTGNAIGIERLQARPVATLCLEAQEVHEREEQRERAP